VSDKSSPSYAQGTAAPPPGAPAGSAVPGHAMMDAHQQPEAHAAAEQ